ncbi:MAG: 4-hydroxy-tetrahydrodipicolinate reductase [Clostridia bacterium]|nr:4-hydroxy-tetrahydrodipicolinate reductase [Clostridia bacterium]
MNIIICGAYGRMGREVALAARQAGVSIVAGVDAGPRQDVEFPVYASFSQITSDADVIVDFSRPAALGDLLAFARARRIACVLAATGYGERENALIAEAAKEIPLFVSANLSVGVYALKKLAQQARALLPGADVEIIEKHHRNKADAPSGTALALLQAISDKETQPVFGRNGKEALRAPHEIGVHAVRGGTLCGEHEIDFLMDNEVITISHSAQSRAIFANGALRAAAFVSTQPAGLYGMDDLFA